MKIKFSKPKGQRILKQLDSISVQDTPNGESYWWEASTEKWVTMVNGDENSIHTSEHSNDFFDMYQRYHPSYKEKAPKSFKALMKYLKRHPEICKPGYVITASTRFVGHSLTVEF